AGGLRRRRKGGALPGGGGARLSRGGGGAGGGRPVYVPPIDPGRIAAPSREIYGVMGEVGITRMIEDFYRELERSPVRDLFPEDMVAAARKSAAFFVGLLGGPPLYQQRYGNPMMRARHMKFVITPRARAEWLAGVARAPARWA